MKAFANVTEVLAAICGAVSLWAMVWLLVGHDENQRKRIAECEARLSLHRAAATVCGDELDKCEARRGALHAGFDALWEDCYK